MKISVIIPTYEPKSYLWDCLDSLRNQTFPSIDFEIVLVLNGCKEPYYSQIATYITDKLQGINVNFIHTDQDGVSNARNIAIDVSKGEFITFIDDDDYVSSEFLNELNSISSNRIVGLCYPIAFYDHGEIYKDYVLTKEYSSHHKYGMQRFTKSRKYFQGPCMKLFSRDIIGDRRFNTNFKNGEDSLFMFLISDKLLSVDYTSTNAIYYRRIRKDSATYKQLSRLYTLVNSFKMITNYCDIYLLHVRTYNFYFFITRVLGAVRQGFQL